MTSPIAQKARELLNETRVRFLIVGAWNALFGYVLFWVLYEVFSRVFTVHYVAYTSAQVVGWVVAVMIAYGLHKHVTFRSKTTGLATGLEFLRFMQTHVVMLGLGLALLPLLVEIVGLDPRIAALIGTGVVAVVSYVGHRFFTFRRPAAGMPRSGS